MNEELFRHHLKAARLFGCMPAFLLALGMGFVVFVGSMMGDCEPGPGCHDHDGLHILTGFLWTLLIVTAIGIASWLVSGTLRMGMRPRVGAVATNAVLIAMTMLIVWFGFSPAMELLLNITAPAAK